MFTLLKFLQNPSFRTRTKVSICIILIIVAGFLSENAIGIRLLFWFASAIAIAEFTVTFFFAATPPFTVTFANIGAGIVGWYLWTAACMAADAIIDHLPPKIILLCLVAAYGADALAYLVGSLIGGKLIKSQPFPKISPHKSWEGLLAGVTGIIPIIYFLNTHIPSSTPKEQAACQIFMLGGIIATFGDISESWIKRQMGLRDSNDEVITLPIFSIIEKWLGGKNGHGGYADRIDSLLTVILICGGYYLCTTTP